MEAPLRLALKDPPGVRRKIEFEVPGVPQPQGSHRAFKQAQTGRIVIRSDNSARLGPWRLDVKVLAAEAMRGREPLRGPVRVNHIFCFPRPGYHFNQRVGGAVLKTDAPHFSDTRPDLDKLVRAIHDSLKQAQVYRDDGQVAQLSAEKIFREPPCVVVTVEELGEA